MLVNNEKFSCKDNKLFTKVASEEKKVGHTRLI